MGDMGYGYGSEWHLLRYLGRHRAELDRRILDVVGGESIEWRDFEFDPSTSFGDRELRGLAFLPADDAARIGWAKVWPRSGNAQNWDAVARIHNGSAKEWLLIEAKANTEELASACQAEQGKPGRALIDETLRNVKRRLGVDASRDWMSGYYQHANRIAVLDFLIGLGVPAKLLFIYFTGDRNGDLTCPADEEGWQRTLAEQDAHLGIGSGHLLTPYVHKLFLPANPGVGRRGRRQAVPASKPVTVFDLIKDVAGAVNSGVDDLATNPKYMEGFGQDRFKSSRDP